MALGEALPDDVCVRLMRSPCYAALIASTRPLRDIANGVPGQLTSGIGESRSWSSWSSSLHRRAIDHIDATRWFPLFKCARRSAGVRCLSTPGREPLHRLLRRDVQVGAATLAAARVSEAAPGSSLNPTSARRTSARPTDRPHRPRPQSSIFIDSVELLPFVQLGHSGAFERVRSTPPWLYRLIIKRIQPALN